MKASFLLALSLLASAASAAAQPYPTKPLRLLVPFTPGGAQDVVARLFGDKVGTALGARIVVDNRPGAGGLIAAQEAARATPDGYTMLLSSGAQMAIEPALKRQAAYDPLRDFAHVVHLGDAPLVLLAIPALPVSDVKELIAYSKANRNKVNTASTGIGTYTHLTLELFKLATGADLTHVPYKGAAPAFTDLLGGQVQTMFTSTASAAPHVGGNRVKPLAVTSSRRTPAMAKVPTFVESGIPIEVSVWLGIAVPAVTPADRVARLNAEFNRALELAEVKGAARLLAAARAAGGWFDVVHMHGERIMFELLKDYDVDALNWHVGETPPAIAEYRANGGTRPILGGLQRGHITRRDLPSILADLERTLQETGGRGILVAPPCVIRHPVDDATLQATAAAIRAAPSR